jgi:hypothetical protein
MIATPGMAHIRGCLILLLLGATVSVARPQAILNSPESAEGVSATDSPAAEDSERRGEEARADEGAPAIVAIKAAWLRRQKAADTVKCEWVETRTFDGAERTLHYSLRLKDVDKLNLWRRGPIPQSGGPIDRDYVHVFDGGVSKIYHGADSRDAASYPVGFVRSTPTDWDNLHVFPLLMTFRPLNPFYSPTADDEWTVVPQSQTINGRPCVLVQSKQMSFQYYVDSEREYTIVRVVRLFKGKETWHMDVEYERDENRNWLPVRWRGMTRYGTGEIAISAEVSAPGVVLNEDAADADFSFEFPPKTLVTDRLLSTPIVFLTQDDGGVRIVTSAERRKGIDYPRLVKLLEAEQAQEGDDP